MRGELKILMTTILMNPKIQHDKKNKIKIEEQSCQYHWYVRFYPDISVHLNASTESQKTSFYQLFTQLQ